MRPLDKLIIGSLMVHVGELHMQGFAASAAIHQIEPMPPELRLRFARLELELAEAICDLSDHLVPRKAPASVRQGFRDAYEAVVAEVRGAGAPKPSTINLADLGIKE